MLNYFGLSQGHLKVITWVTWPLNLPSSPRTIIQFTCESSFCGKDEVVIVTAPKNCWGFITRVRHVEIQSHMVDLRSLIFRCCFISDGLTQRFRDENWKTSPYLIMLYFQPSKMEVILPFSWPFWLMILIFWVKSWSNISLLTDLLKWNNGYWPRPIGLNQGVRS